MPEFSILFIFSPVVIIYIIIIIVVIAIHRQRRKRTLWLYAFAKAIGFSFAEKAPSSFIYPLKDFALFGARMFSWQVKNLAAGEMDNVSIQMFDYNYKVRIGIGGGLQGGVTNSQTVIIFTSDRIQLPHFSLRPKNVIRPNHPRFGEEHMRHRINQRFTQAYFLQGEDETAVRALFDEEVCEHYGRLLTKSSEGKDNTLIYYYEGHLIASELIDEFLEEAMQTFNLFATKSKLVSILKQNNQLH